MRGLVLRSAVTLAALLLIATPLVSAQDASAPERPSYTFLRQAEDWSRFFSGAADADTFDPIKHVEITSDGSVWASFGGRVEARFELWRNFLFGAEIGDAPVDDEFVVSRMIVHGDLHVGDRFRAYVEGKSAQATERELAGGRRGIDMDTIALQQAFVDFTTLTENGYVRIRPGRQALLFGAQRLVSPLPWGNTLRTWDGVTAEWRTGPWSVTGLATWFVPVDKTEFNDVDRDQPLYGVYARRDVNESGRGLELYGLGSGRENVVVNGTAGDARRWTLGARSWGALSERTDLEIEAAYQLGEVGEGDVSAWFVAAEAGWKPVDALGDARFWVGLDAASGDDEFGGDVGTFDQLYPLGHAYLGYADFVGRQNSLAVSAGVTWRLEEDTTLSIDAHHFRVMESDDALYSAGGQPIRSGFTSSEVGHEVDVLLQTNLGRHVRAYAGYSRFFAGAALEETGAAEDVDFVYVGTSFTF